MRGRVGASMRPLLKNVLKAKEKATLNKFSRVVIPISLYVLLRDPSPFRPSQPGFSGGYLAWLVIWGPFVPPELPFVLN